MVNCFPSRFRKFVCRESLTWFNHVIEPHIYTLNCMVANLDIRRFDVRRLSCETGSCPARKIRTLLDIFSRPDIHVPVELPAVCRNNASVEDAGKTDANVCFPRCRRPAYDNEWMFFHICIVLYLHSCFHSPCGFNYSLLLLCACCLFLPGHSRCRILSGFWQS